MHRFHHRLPAPLALAAVVSCSPAAELTPFTSDGCSLFPDASQISGEEWCECCFEHDLAYWRGGTAAEREAADKRLRECVLEKTGEETLATLMYEGVRLGGSPYFYNWYRWGYGWGYERKYRPLTGDETARADSLQREFLSSAEDDVCAAPQR